MLQQITSKLTRGALMALAPLVLVPGMAVADSISPTSYTDTLALGESVTIRKTVTINASGPTDAVLDIMFVFDVTGSMGGEIANAKATANATLATLAGFGSLTSGSGWYSDPLHDGVHVDLNAGNTGASSGINDMWDTGNCDVAGVDRGCGGDFPEVGYAGIKDAATDASWRPGSNRVIIAFGDASFKTGPAGDDNAAATAAALADNNVDLIGVSFNSGFSTGITGLGGEVFAGGSTGAQLAAAILDGISSSFATYSEVTVDDLGLGMPGVGVSTECVSADIGACVGDTAVGSYDRSVDRTFDFDVTFTALAEGEHDFLTHALADGGILASEHDNITVTVSEPGTIALLGMGLLGFGARTRRTKR